MAYTPYKMKGSPMYRNYGVGNPPKGTTGGDEASTEKPAPTKKWWKKAAKFLNPLGPAMAAGKAIKGLKGKNEQLNSLEERVTALEGGGGGGEAAAAQGAAADPAAAAAAEAGDPAAAAEATKKGMAAGIAPSAPMAAGLSDIRAKEKIEKTGISPSGIPIYEFNYIGSEARYSGTMAQDLLKMGVDAVSMHEDGYYRVNYNNIDVDMRQIN
tara:strand:- start:54 stop:689 length:636 start_codon:yes stop_codon:yes gene_type:complete